MPDSWRRPAIPTGRPLSVSTTEWKETTAERVHGVHLVGEYQSFPKSGKKNDEIVYALLSSTLLCSVLYV